METQSDEARIERLARAMCRAARRNPDERLLDPDGGSVAFPTRFSAEDMTIPAWVQFRAGAERFVAMHRSSVEPL
ncbi:hypothetical protein AXW83_22915 [Bosea sp. PAMC 26642]|nr:hypothetical protein AXW83_22915 [Bosea sp. PAMC 26642]